VYPNADVYALLVKEGYRSAPVVIRTDPTNGTPGWDWDVDGNGIGITGIEGAPAEMPVGGTLTLTGTVMPDPGTWRNIVWTVKEAGNTGASISRKTGGAYVLTASAAGTVTVTATVPHSGATLAEDYAADFNIDVKSVSVTGVSIKPENVEVAKGASKSLTVTVSPGNATNKAVTWKSNNTNVVTVNSSGKVTGVTVGGPVKITVTTGDGGFTADCYVTVKPVTVTGVKINKTSNNLSGGKTETLSATVLPDNATNKAVTWKSNDTSVATVDSSGRVTAQKKSGTAIITVTTDEGGHTAYCEVTVTWIPVTEITFASSSTKHEKVGSGTQDVTRSDDFVLYASVMPGNATNREITWTIPSGVNCTYRTTALIDINFKDATVGSFYTITATAKDGSNTTASCTFWVTK
jgi:uncharacterized protein YjdB